jgi:hypothetical protein
MLLHGVVCDRMDMGEGASMTKLDRVKKIAAQVRQAFEEIARTQGYRSDLGGLCGRATAQLYLACRRKGIKIKMWRGLGHAFNECDGHIVDITATQFGKVGKVHIRKMRFPLNRPYHYRSPVEVTSARACALYFGGGRGKFEKDGRIVRRYMEEEKR